MKSRPESGRALSHVPGAWNLKRFASVSFRNNICQSGAAVDCTPPASHPDRFAVLQGRVQFLAKRHAVKLVLHRAMESFADAVSLRRFCPGATVIDILYRQVELIFVMLTLAAV